MITTATRLLVVDDDPVIAECVSLLLTKDGYTVSIALSATDALNRARVEERFRIVILDLHMPVVGGIEFLRLLREFDREAAVIVLTGYPSLNSATDAINLDVSGYIRKPVSAEDLREAVARVARSKGIVARREDVLQLAIGHRVKRLRSDKRVSLKELSRLTGVSVSQLSQIERAESLASTTSLLKIADGLGVRLSELLDGF